MSKRIPAFPVTLQNRQAYGDHQEFDGMTLRDYFAAKVLPSVYDRVFMDIGKNGFVANWEHGIAQDAYAMADAMLEARK